MFLITCCATFVFCIINAVNNVRVNYFYHCIPTFAPPCIEHIFCEIQYNQIIEILSFQVWKQFSSLNKKFYLMNWVIVNS